MTNKELAQKILEKVGGKSNITAAATCMTRLRLELRDESKVDVDGLKAIEGVLGVVDADGVQVVLGPGKVNKVGMEFSDLVGVSLGDADATDEGHEAEKIAKENKELSKSKQTNPVQKFLKRIANIFVPLLPGIIAAGLINGITNVINVTSGGALTGVWWYETIRTMGWALFTFLPVFVGMNAAKEFKGSPVLGGIAGALSIAIPSMPLLAEIDGANIIMPLTNAPYNPGIGGLLAALIIGIFIAYLERSIKKIMPDLLDTFLTPLLTLIIGSIIAVVILQPLGTLLTQGIFAGLNFIFVKLGVLGGFILSTLFLPLVSVGLHQALTPIHAMLNDPAGPTMGVNYLLPILMMAGGGQVGAGLAIYVKTKNKKVKQLTRDSIPVGILGIGEPLMYAVTLPLGKPFITACLGSGIGGILASLFNLGAISQGVSGLFGLLIMQPGTQVKYLIAMIGAYIGGFVLTYFFGVDEKRINEVYGEN